MPRFTVVIPTLNEADLIEQVVERALATAPSQRSQILVVDGGSDDGTVDLVEDKVPVIKSEPGRAHQMNLGAERSEGDWILFCHGDTLLPANYHRAVERALANPAVIGGAFTPEYRPSHPWLKLVEMILSLPTSKLFFGDSALFYRRRHFEAVGGYPQVPLMEEVVLNNRLQTRGRLIRLPERVITSSRRFFERGVLRQLLLDVWLLFGYHLLGRTPVQLAPSYWQTERDRSQPPQQSDQTT